jgi:hypothetical protein
MTAVLPIAITFGLVAAKSCCKTYGLRWRMLV